MSHVSHGHTYTHILYSAHTQTPTCMQDTDGIRVDTYNATKVNEFTTLW